MTFKNLPIKFLIGACLLIILPLSCKDRSEGNKEGNGLNGTLNGKISIGPICPVETDPPSPGCQPTEETYQAHAVAVWTKDGKIKIGVLNPQIDGTYVMDLPAGNYIVDLDYSNFGIGGSNLPVSITIKPGMSLNLAIDIDTGIR